MHESMTLLKTQLFFDKETICAWLNSCQHTHAAEVATFKMRCRMRLDELIPLLVHLVLEQLQLPLWWQTHKLCRADCEQESDRSHSTPKLLH